MLSTPFLRSSDATGAVRDAWSVRATSGSMQPIGVYLQLLLLALSLVVGRRGLVQCIRLGCICSCCYWRCLRCLVGAQQGAKLSSEGPTENDRANGREEIRWRQRRSQRSGMGAASCGSGSRCGCSTRSCLRTTLTSSSRAAPMHPIKRFWGITTLL